MGAPSPQALAQQGESNLPGWLQGIGDGLNKITGGGAGEAWDVIDDPLMGVLSILDKPRAIVTSTVKEAQDLLVDGESASFNDWWSQIGRNIGGGEIVEDWGVDNIWYKRLAGFGLEVALDPINWLSFGTLGSAKGGVMAAGRALDLASDANRLGQTAHAARLANLGTKITRRGGVTLSRADVSYLQAAEAATKTAAKYGDDINWTNIIDLDGRIAPQFADDMAPLLRNNAQPEFLRAGGQMNVPGTGRVAQRVANRLSPQGGIGRAGGAVLPTKTVQVIPQAALKYTPRGMYMTARGAITGKASVGAIRNILGGDYADLKKMMASGSDADVLSAYSTYKSVEVAAAAEKRLLNEQMENLLTVVQALPKELRQDGRKLMLAMNGNEAAIAEIGEETMTLVRNWADQLRDTANKVAGDGPSGPFLPYLENWTPNTPSRQALEIIRNLADDGSDPIFARARSAADVDARVANIRPGGKFFNQEIYAIGDAKNVGNLTPRQQAEAIFKNYLADNGHDATVKLFNDDFGEAASMAVRSLVDDVGRARMVNELAARGVAVDLTQLQDVSRAAARAKQADAARAVEVARRNYDRQRGMQQTIRDHVGRRLDEARARLDEAKGKKRALKDEARGDDVFRDRVNAVVDKAEKQKVRAEKARQELIDEAAKGPRADLKRLQKLRDAVERTDGALAKRISKLEAERFTAFEEINRLHADLSMAQSMGVTGRKGSKSAGQKVGDTGAKIKTLTKKIRKAEEELEILREYSRLDPSSVTEKRKFIGQADEAIIEIQQEIAELPYGIAGGPERVQLKAQLESIKQAKADAQHYIDVTEGLISDIPTGEAGTKYWKNLAKTDEALERLSAIIGLEVTTSNADAIYRQLISDPNSIVAFRVTKAIQEAGENLEVLRNDLDVLHAAANTPKVEFGPNGTILTNALNEENVWGYARMTDDGPVMVTRTTDVPSAGPDGVIRDARTGRAVPEQTYRYRVESARPKLYWTGEADMVHDKVQAALRGGLTPTPDWPEGWVEVAQMVKDNVPLHKAIGDVWPTYAGRAGQKIEELMEPGILSGYQRQRMGKLWNRHLTDTGYDSVGFAGVDGHWNVIPMDRRALQGFGDELPDTMHMTIARHHDRLVAEIGDNIQAKTRLAEELGGDIEELSGRMVSSEHHKIELERLIGEAEDELDRAVTAADELGARRAGAALKEHNEALRLQEAANEHLDNAARLRAEGAADIDIQIEMFEAEVAKLESVNRKVWGKRLRKADGEDMYSPTNLEQSVKKAKKELKKAQKVFDDLMAIPEETFEQVMPALYKQVGWDSDRAIPAKIADALKGSKLFNKNSLLQHYDSFLKVWRAAATTSPGFHSRNYFGGIINNVHADINPAMYSTWRTMDRTLELLEYGGGNVRRRTPLAGPAARTGEEALDNAVTVLKAKGKVTLPNGQTLRGRNMDPKMVDDWAAVVRSGVAEQGQFDELGARGVQLTNRSTGRKAADLTPFSPNWRPYRASRNFGGNVEATLRGALALDTLSKGGTIDDAIGVVHKFHFDYSDLSNIERNVLHRMSAFYTWTRKNLPLQLEMMASNPRAFNRYLAIQRNIEVGQEEDENLIPDFIERSSRIKLPWGDNVYLTPETPFSNLTQMMSLKGLITSTAPPVSVTVDMLRGKDSFTNSPFADRYKHVSVTWGAIPGLLPALESIGKVTRDAEGRPMVSAGTEDVIKGLFPMLSTMYRLAPPRAEEGETPRSGQRTREEQISSAVSWAFGIGNYVATPSRQRNVLMGQYYDLQNEGTRLLRLGYEEEARALYDQARDYRDEVDKLFPEDGSAPQQERGMARQPLVSRPSTGPAGGTGGAAPHALELPASVQEDDVQWNFDLNAKTISVSWPGGRKTLPMPLGIGAEDDIGYDFKRLPSGAVHVVFSKREPGSF